VASRRGSSGKAGSGLMNLWSYWVPTRLI